MKMREMMRLVEGRSAAIVIKAAQTFAHLHGVTVSLTIDGPREIALNSLTRTSGERGSGGKFLADLTQLADQHQVSIKLRVLLGSPKLIALYQKFGFVLHDEDEDYDGFEEPDPVMIREPR